MTSMPGRPAAGELRPLKDVERELEGRLRDHVAVLAGDIGERNVFRPDRLERAARHLEKTLESFGYPAAGQRFECQGVEVRNLEAEVAGRSRPGEVVVVGAHYDSVVGCPGANDNGSGVAAVLELARRWRGRGAARTVRFVLFVNEEPPFFQTGDMGSLHYARRSKERGENVVAMLSLETMGFFTDEEGSQQYPFPFSLFYPSRGNFIAFVGNISSQRLVRRSVATFRRHASIPSEGAAVPGAITGVGWSDHWAFWENGYPGVMVTDTAPFRYPEYHTPGDTPDRVRFSHLARVVAGLEAVVADLAGG
jgi:Zn-dependent M28 family amino/carboxypeptidase